MMPFDLACHNGHLETAMWPKNLNPAKIVLFFSRYDYTNLRKEGHTKVADWLL